MTNAEIEAAKAAFLAKGGAIKQVASDAGLNLSAREWAERVRTPKAEQGLTIEQQAEIAQQRGVEEAGYYKS